LSWLSSVAGESLIFFAAQGHPTDSSPKSF
jgi:hypothetical protein